MATNIGFVLTVLLFPLLIELFNLQSELQIAPTDHMILEALILVFVYWLLMQILRMDNRLYLRSLGQQKNVPEKESRGLGR